MYRELFFIGLASCASSLVQAFTFTHGTPTQCDNLSVSWTGGQPPFRLLIIPPGGSTRNISIPSSAFSNNQGSFQTQLTLPKNQKLLLSMSDATGFTAGGTTDVLTVGDSIGGQNCNTTDPGVDFFFSTDTPLSQCQPYPFTSFDGAVLPITIIGYIPSGQSFVLNPPPANSFNWTANLAAGTSVVFSMIDSQNRIGGSAGITVVLRTTDASCLSGSPSSTHGSTQTGGATSSTSPSPGSHSNISIAIIAGIAVGGAIFLIVLGAIILLFIRQRRRESSYRPSRKTQALDLTYGPVGGPAPEPANFLSPGYESTSYDPVHVQPYPQNSQSYPPDPQRYTSNYSPHLQDSQLYSRDPQPYASHLNPHLQNPQPYSRDPQLASNLSPHLQDLQPYLPDSQASISSNQRSSNTSASLEPLLSIGSTATGAISGHSDRSSRVIIHTDIEETPGEDDVLELPPQYSDRRTPLPNFTSPDLELSSASGSSTVGTSSAPSGKGGKRG